MGAILSEDIVEMMKNYNGTWKIVTKESEPSLKVGDVVFLDGDNVTTIQKGDPIGYVSSTSYQKDEYSTTTVEIMQHPKPDSESWTEGSYSSWTELDPATILGCKKLKEWNSPEASPAPPKEQKPKPKLPMSNYDRWDFL